jgi:lipoprotein-anchoring transpeptidase ErfK/SrfK
MPAHRWGTARRPRVLGRVAAAVALAVVAGSVLIGVGAADEGPAPVPVDLGVPAADVPALPRPAAVEPAPARRSPAAPAEEAQPAPAIAPAAAPAAVPRPEVSRDGLVPGTPCTPTARACVDSVGRYAWLIDDGRVVRGPVNAMVGDREDPTPRGTFRVEWKAEKYTSREYLVQMPYSVFFAPGGVAFHEGNQETNSAGCVKLGHDDAVAFFRFLQVGDEVQVH